MCGMREGSRVREVNREKEERGRMCWESIGDEERDDERGERRGK